MLSPTEINDRCHDIAPHIVPLIMAHGPVVISASLLRLACELAIRFGCPKDIWAESCAIMWDTTKADFERQKKEN